MLKTYGLSIGRYNEMFREQNGNCAICNRNRTEFKKELCVDHCHTTGRVRGLLCDACNNGLARFRDDPWTIKRALAYLDRQNLQGDLQR